MMTSRSIKPMRLMLLSPPPRVSTQSQSQNKAVPEASTYRVCFSPHKDASLSMKPLADAVNSAEKWCFTPLPFVARKPRPSI